MRGGEKSSGGNEKFSLQFLNEIIVTSWENYKPTVSSPDDSFNEFFVVKLLNYVAGNVIRFYIHLTQVE